MKQLASRRYEEEKEYIVILEAIGIFTATYSADTAMGDATVDDRDNDEDVHLDEELGSLSTTPTVSLDGKSLYIFYDCETTSGSHYNDHVIQASATVMVPDNISITTPEFSSLCRTSYHIAVIGKQWLEYTVIQARIYIYSSVSKKCDTTAQNALWSTSIFCCL